MAALFALVDGAYVPYAVDAPDIANRDFRTRFPYGLPPDTPLRAWAEPSADCLRGGAVVGFDLVVFEGGSVDQLEACARRLGVAALYTIADGRYVPFIPGAPDVVNRPFRELFAGGLPASAPLMARGGPAPAAEAAAADASLNALRLEGVVFGTFSPGRTEYAGEPGSGVTKTTVWAYAESGAGIRIQPPDADANLVNSHQVALAAAGTAITVAVTAPDGVRTRLYRVWVAGDAPDAGDPAADCLRGDIAAGFSLAVYAGGAVEELAACARGLGVVALYALADGAYVPYIVEAPAIAHRAFRDLFPHGLPPDTPLVVAGGGPAGGGN